VAHVAQVAALYIAGQPEHIAPVHWPGPHVQVQPLTRSPVTAVAWPLQSAAAVQSAPHVG
jgi:hypothetical protein